MGTVVSASAPRTAAKPTPLTPEEKARALYLAETNSAYTPEDEALMSRLQARDPETHAEVTRLYDEYAASHPSSSAGGDWMDAIGSVVGDAVSDTPIVGDIYEGAREYVPGLDAALDVPVDYLDYATGGDGNGGKTAQVASMMPTSRLTHEIGAGAQSAHDTAINATGTAMDAIGSLPRALDRAFMPQTGGGAGAAAAAAAGGNVASTQNMILDRLNGAGQGVAPQMTAAQAGRTSIANPRQIVGSNIAGTNIERTAPMGASLSHYVGLAPAQQAQASEIGDVERARQVAINQDPQAEIRAQQMRTMQALQGRADGTAPSVVEMQLKRAADRNVANQFSMAASARAPQQAGALRRAMINSGRLNASASADAAEARIKEMDAATNTLAGVQSGVRGADIGLAGKQADLDSSTGQFNAGAANAARMRQAELGTQTSQFNAGQGNDMSRAQGQLDSSTAQFNAGANNDASKTNATLAAQRAQQQAQLDQARNLAQADDFARTQTFNANAVNTRDQAQANLDAALNQWNAGAQNQASAQNIETALRQQGLNDAQIATYLNALLTGQGQQVSLASAQAGLDYQKEADRVAFNRQLAGGLIGTGADALTQILGMSGGAKTPAAPSAATYYDPDAPMALGSGY